MIVVESSIGHQLEARVRVASSGGDIHATRIAIAERSLYCAYVTPAESLNLPYVISKARAGLHEAIGDSPLHEKDPIDRLRLALTSACLDIMTARSPDTINDYLKLQTFLGVAAVARTVLRGLQCTERNTVDGIQRHKDLHGLALEVIGVGVTLWPHNNDGLYATAAPTHLDKLCEVDLLVMGDNPERAIPAQLTLRTDRTEVEGIPLVTPNNLFPRGVKPGRYLRHLLAIMAYTAEGGMVSRENHQEMDSTRRRLLHTVSSGRVAKPHAVTTFRRQIKTGPAVAHPAA